MSTKGLVEVSCVANTCELVLLLDDTSLDNFISEKMMEQLQFAKKIEVETYGERVLDSLEDRSLYSTPDLILMDINMPIMNGFQFIEAFKKQPSYIIEKCKIVVLSSSFYSPEVDRISRDDLVLGFISKPLTLDGLMHVKELLLNANDSA